MAANEGDGARLKKAQEQSEMEQLAGSCRADDRKFSAPYRPHICNGRQDDLPLTAYHSTNATRL